MTSVTLELRYRHETQHEAAAWFVPGVAPEAWLSEMNRWQVPLVEARLHILPVDSTSAQPCGVLVTLPARSVPRVSARVQPYGVLAERFYVPTNAQFDPPLSEVELADQLLDDDVYVFHPQCGLMRFSNQERLKISGLFAPLMKREIDWNRAEPGTVFNHRLLSVEFAGPLSIETVLDEGRDDIGRRSDEAKTLPRSPGESPFANADKLWKLPLLPIAHALHAAARRAPRTASAPTWVDKIANWSEKIIGGLAQRMHAARTKEMRRLLHLLESNPDEGLQFALPIAGVGDAPRGTAIPSDRLNRRDVDFRLGQFDGARALDVWDVPDDVQRQLSERYRELAARELRLKRYRRAAYIFAELLAELESAASALKAGRHFRDAAILYRDRLQRPLDAARCMEEGGLLSDAISLYRELGQDERAGDLYERLDQSEEARECYQHALSRFHDRGEMLEAARIAEKKLDDIDLAVSCYDIGWSIPGQSAACLRAMFELLGRTGQHAGAVTRLRRQTLEADSTRAEPFVEAMTDVALSYPDADFRRQAADSVRVVSSQRMNGASREESRRLVRHVCRLAPEDRLLGRDGARFLRQRQTVAAVAPVKRSRSSSPFKLVREIVLPGGIEWHVAVSTRWTYYVAGFRGDQLHVSRGPWDYEDVGPVSIHWDRGNFMRRPVLLASQPNDRAALLVHVVGEEPLKEQEFPASPIQTEFGTTGSAAWMTRDLIGLARGPNGVAWGLTGYASGLVLNSYDRHGVPLDSQSLQVIPDLSLDEVSARASLPVPFHVRDEAIYVGQGRYVHRASQRGRNTLLHFDASVRSLVGSAANTRPRIAVTFDQGGVVFWGDGNCKNQHSFGRELENPIAAFTRKGTLIAACREEVQAYSTQNEKLTWVGSDDSLGDHLFAVLPLAGNDFALCSRRGWIRIYTVAAEV